MVRFTAIKFRWNPFNIEMITENMRKSIFDKDVVSYYENTDVSKQLLDLKKHSLKHKKNSSSTAINVNLPLDNKNVMNLFYSISKNQCENYKYLSSKILNNLTPTMPNKWNLNSGWTKYVGDTPYSILVPEEEVYVFDVEVCINDPGNRPTMAIALSPSHWYSWCSPLLMEVSYNASLSQNSMIPIEKNAKLHSLVIGHNVAYDRTWIKEQYNLQKSNMRFMDTMSLHLACSGLTHLQRLSKLARKREVEKLKKLGDSGSNQTDFVISPFSMIEGDWRRLGALNNLADIHELYCGNVADYEAGKFSIKSALLRENKQTREKASSTTNHENGSSPNPPEQQTSDNPTQFVGNFASPLDIFLNGRLPDVVANFQLCALYCARDCLATLDVFRVLYPMFLKRFPHPVTFAGMLEMGTAYLPTRKSTWSRYINQCENLYNEIDYENRLALANLADEACSMLHNQKYKKDPWLWDLDWSVQKLKLNKNKTVGKGEKSKNSIESDVIESNYKDLPQNSKPKFIPTAQFLENYESLRHETENSQHVEVLDYESIPNFDGNLSDLIKLKLPTSTESATNENILDINNDNKNSNLNNNINLGKNSKITNEKDVIQRVLDTAQYLPKTQPFMPGYPAWYRELCEKPPKDLDINRNHNENNSHTESKKPHNNIESDPISFDIKTLSHLPISSLDQSHLLSSHDVEKLLNSSATTYPRHSWKPGPFKVTSLARVAPKLLRLTWNGYPLYFHPKYKWGYLVPGNLSNLPKNSDLNKEGEQPRTSFVLQNLPHYIDLIKSLNDENAQEKDKPNRKRLHNDTLMEDVLWKDVLNSTYDGNLDDLNQNFSKYMEFSKKMEKLYNLTDNMKHGDGKLNDRKSNNAESEGDTGIGCQDIPGCWYYPLPHKNGPTNRVGNPLSKDFISRLEDGTLKSCSGTLAEKVLNNSKIISYWKNARLRILSQPFVEYDDDHMTKNEDDEKYGAILPKLIVCGTVSRRAVEPTWLTASNSRPDRLGSELKAMIQAPPDHCLVGADVDSQELWIASILGDAANSGVKMHGCTPFGWMTIQGNKLDKTDMHSKTAELMGISRDEAKVLNYARIYGAGQIFASRLLKQFKPSLTKEEAAAKAREMFRATKGRKVANTDCVPQDLSSNLAQQLSSNKQWQGGTESCMFNKLEEIATHPQPATPFLKSRICRTLEPRSVHQNFMTSRMNWVVQSSAVDFLHLMLVCMKWLFDTYNIDGRFCISIHDEVRYLVREKDKYRAALALQITNLLTRSFFSYQLGMYDLPLSVAFFSTVDIDKCLRKEVDMDCITPSNLDGLHINYGIGPGEALTIHDIIEKTGGSLEQ